MKKLMKIENNSMYYNNYNLASLAEKYGTPLRVTFLDVIYKRVKELKNSFDKAIKELSYQGKFIYLNANKANYGSREVETSFIASDGLETSSYYDMLFTHELFKKHPEFKDKYLVCNGYKRSDYINAILKAYQEGYKVIDVIDSLDEYETLKKSNEEIEIGLRIHLKALYKEEDEDIENDRFGLMDKEVNYILNDLKNTKLKLTTIHFHQRGFEYEDEKFRENFCEVFNNYYVKAKRMYDTVVNFDMGGGTPLGETYDFDYNHWAKEVIKLLKELSNKHQIEEPNLISENGKYSQKDACVNIYKVVAKKYTDKYPWFLIDGSLLIAMPEYYALGEPILVEPLNNLDAKMIKARLGGLTCDCDDVYAKENGYILLPECNEPLYIGLLGTGSYQASMNGKGGIHHCLLPEEIDLVIDDLEEDHKEIIRHPLQSIDDVLKLNKFKN